MVSRRSSNPPALEQPVSVDDMVGLLAPTLGQEKSEEVIITGAAALGHRLDRLTFEKARQILGKLGAEPGIVGVASRFALTRLVPATQPSVQLKVAPLRSGRAEKVRAIAAEEAAAKTIGHENVAQLLAHSLGIEQAKAAVAAAV